MRLAEALRLGSQSLSAFLSGPWYWYPYHEQELLPPTLDAGAWPARDPVWVAAAPVLPAPP